MLFIKLLTDWLFQSNPSKKFRSELNLMFWGKDNAKFVRRYFQRRLFYVYNCEVSYTAIIHPTVKFGHPSGIFIGSNAAISEGCVVYQQVTIGTNFTECNGMPSIGKGTVISAGSKVIGDITVGAGCIIGANAVVTKDVPDDATVVGFNRLV